jgi:hypothetical protein
MNKTTWIILAITGITALTAIADAFFKIASEREQGANRDQFARIECAVRMFFDPFQAVIHMTNRCVIMSSVFIGASSVVGICFPT